jgi:predicted aconitase with swiveling domain
MSNLMTMKGRRVSPGKAQGLALVSQQRIGFNFGVDPSTGIIVERGHELEGKSIKDVILVFPAGKGSTGGSFMIYQLSRCGTGPKAMINEKTETIVAVGAVMGNIPVVDKLDKNPLELIENGDRVEVDGDNGTVKVWKLDHKP